MMLANEPSFIIKWWLNKAESAAATKNQKSLLGFAGFAVTHPLEQV